MSADASELRTLGADLSKAGGRAGMLANQALRKTTADVIRDAKILAPVDTGNLRNSISADITGTDTTTEAVIGPTAHYGVYQEMGTSRNKPQPYLRPAFDRNVPAFEQAMGQIIDRALG